MKKPAHMHIREISQFEFDTLFPSRPTLESYVGPLVQWFADNENNILGAIDHERTGTWSYVVLKRSPDGAVRVVEINDNLVNQDAARLELLPKMEIAGESA